MIVGGTMLLVLLLLVLLLFRPFSKAGTHESFEAIPDNACAVFKMNNPGNLLQQNSGVPEQLNLLTPVVVFFNGLGTADSILRTTTTFANLLSSGNLLVSIHPSGIDKMECLFVFEPTSETEVDAISDELELTETDIDGQSCFVFGQKKFYVTLFGNLIVASFSENLLKQSISTIENKSGLRNNEAFTKSYHSLSPNSQVGVLLNLPLLYRSLGLLFSEQTYPNLGFIQNFSTWGNLEISFKENALSFSGLFPLGTDGTSFMNLFDQPRNEISAQVFGILPVNTSTAFAYGFSDFVPFFDAYMQRLSEAKNNAFNHESETRHLNDELETTNFQECLYSGIDGALIVFSSSNNVAQEPDVFGAFPISDAKMINECLRSEAKKHDWDTLSFRDIPIYILPLEYGAYSLFGPLFESIEGTCIAVCENTVYIGASAGSLKSMLNHILSGRTLATSRFQSKLKDFVSSSWNTMAYLNLSGAMYYLQNRWLSDTSLIKTSADMYRSNNSGVISLACSRQSDGIVLSGTWIFDKSDSTDKYTWFSGLDAKVASDPVVLVDSKTNEYWIAVSDVYENLYLLNSDGQILWKKNLGDVVHSDYQLLFQGKGNERCIAFTTRKALYLIGLDGKIHNGFPVTFSEGIGSNLLAADYDNNNNYRLLFCDKQGKLLNFNTSGKPTEGWLKPSTGLNGEFRVFYRPLEKKDFLLVCSSEQEVAIIDRKGNRMKTVTNISFNRGLPNLFAWFTGKRWIALSSDGTLVFVSPEGETETFVQQPFGENIIFTQFPKKAVVVGDGSLFIVGEEGHTTEAGKIADSGIDKMEAISTKQGNYIVFQSSSGAIGMVGIGTDYSETALKADIDYFDCFVHKDNIVFISTSDKTISSEKVETTIANIRN